MSYTDTTTLWRKTVTKPLSGEAFLAYNPMRRHSLVTLDYTYQRAIRRPQQNRGWPAQYLGGNITCGSGPFGAPKETMKSSSREVRHAFAACSVSR